VNHYNFASSFNKKEVKFNNELEEYSTESLFDLTNNSETQTQTQKKLSPRIVYQKVFNLQQDNSTPIIPFSVFNRKPDKTNNYPMVFGESISLMNWNKIPGGKLKSVLHVTTPSQPIINDNNIGNFIHKFIQVIRNKIKTFLN
jgi:hypothetical protein